MCLAAIQRRTRHDTARDSDDGTIVGEYSVDKKYFSDLSKPRGDINHALREHPQVNKIYLLAGVRMRPSEGKKMTALCHEMRTSFQGDILWYDVEEIAKYILEDLLPKTEIVRRLSKFLPSLKSIYLSFRSCPKITRPLLRQSRKPMGS